MNCRCGKKAVIYRKYEGTYLCRNHFIRSFERKVKKTIKDSNMISRNDRIIIALSGGKDSSVILHLMNKFFKKRDDLSLHALTIDEGIEGYRNDSIEIAIDLCKKLDIPHTILTFEKGLGKSLDDKLKSLKEKDGNACTYCGVGRRTLLNKGSRNLNASKLCMGMNLDDEIQSIMMDYMKGDIIRLSRMGGKPIIKDKKFIPRIKPLREIPEKEVGLYAILNGLEVQEDECPNLEGPRFRVRDFLNDMESDSPGIKFSVLKTFERLLPNLQETVRKEKLEIKYCEKCGEPTSGSICKTCTLWK